MIIEGDPEKFLTDFYSKKNNEEISQEKLDSILSTYGDNYDRLISDLYSKYDPEGLDDSKLATIKESYKLAPEESLEQKYLVDGIEVDKAVMTKRLYDDEFVEKLQKGEITVDIENDSKLKAIANQQKNSGDAWSDAYESIQIGFNLALQGVLGAETYIEDAINLMGFEDFKFNKILDREVRNEISKQAIKKAEKLEKQIRATEGDFISELSNLNFSRAAKMGLNTTLQSAPLMVASMGAAYATGGSSVIAQALAGAGTMTALLTPAEYVQTLVSEDPNIQKLSKGEKFFRGTARGLAEGIPEGIMGPVGLRGGKILLQGLKGLVKKTGIEAGETAAKGLAKELGKETSLEIAQAFLLGTGAEGVTEFTTSLAQDLTDDFLGVQNLGFEEYLRRGYNAGALGVFMGGVIQGSGITLNSGKNILLRNNSVKQGAVSQIRKEQELGNISKQQGDEIISQIDELQQAVDQTDSDLSNEQQEKITNLIYRKNELNNRIKGLDPSQASVKKAKEEIEAIDKEISETSASEADIDIATKTASVGEAIIDLRLNKTIKFLETQGKKLGKRTYTVEDEFDDNGNLIKSAGEKAQEIYDEYVKENPGTKPMDVSGGDGFRIGNIAVINKTLARQTGAVSVGSHETFHFLVDDYFEGIDIEDRRTLIKDFKNLLSKEQLDAVNKRIQSSYTGIEGFDPETSIEWFTAFSDAIELDQITFNENIGNKILNFVQEILRKVGIKKEFSNARQAYNFMKDYSKSVSKGQASKRALKLSETKQEKTINKQKTIKDSQIPVEKETFEIDRDGRDSFVEVITYKDGSRRFTEKDSDGDVASSQRVSKDNTLTNKDFVEGSYADVVGDSVKIKGTENISTIIAEKTKDSKETVSFSKTEDQVVDLKNVKNQNILNGLVGETDAEGFYKMKKQDFANSEAKKTVDILLNNKAFDRLIGAKIKVTDFAKRQEILERSREEVEKHIARFNPQESKNLFGYINSYIQNKVGTAAKTVLRAPKTVSTDKKIGGEESRATVGETLVSDEISPEEYADIKLAQDKIKKIKPQQSKIAKKIDLTDNEINLVKRDITNFLRKTDRPAMTDPKKFFKAFVDYISTATGNRLYDKLSAPKNGLLSTKNRKAFIESIAEDLIALNKVDPSVMRRSNWTPFYELEIKNMNPTQTQKAIDEGRIPSTTNLKAGNDLFKILDPSVDQVVDYLMNIRPDVFKRKMPKFLAEVIAKNEFNEIVDNSKQPIYDTKGNKTDRTIDLSESITEEEVTRGAPQVREKIARPEGVKFSNTQNNILDSAYEDYISDQYFWSKFSKDVGGKNYDFNNPEQLEKWKKDEFPKLVKIFSKDFLINSGAFYGASKTIKKGPNKGKKVYKFPFTDTNPKKNKKGKLQANHQQAFIDYLNDNFNDSDYGPAFEFEKTVNGKKVKFDPLPIALKKHGQKTDKFNKYFGSKENIENNEIKDRVLKEIFLRIQKANTSTNNIIPAVVGMLRTTAAEQAHFMRKIAPITFRQLGIEKLPSGAITEEHALGASLVAKQSSLLASDKLVDDNFNGIIRNYFQGPISKINDNKVNAKDLGMKEGPQKEDLYRVLIGEISGWIRYAKVPGFNLNTIEILDNNGNKVILTDFFNVGVEAKYRNNPDVIAFQNSLIVDQIANGLDPKAAKELLNEYLKLVPQKTKAIKSNVNNMSNNVVSFSKTSSNQEIIGYAKTVDKALKIARDPNAPIKKIRVFDFDDTLATTKSNVLFSAPNGTEGSLTAEKFAMDGARLLEEGYVFDFSEFNKVTKGKPGPLLDIAKKIQAARGTEDVFVLTARAPEAQVAIKEFLDSVGLNIPLENITGLGNSTGEAKANWMVEKAAEGYNDFYFADDALQNVEAVRKSMDMLDVKSKTQLVRKNEIKFSKTSSKKLNFKTDEAGNIKAGFTINNKKYNIDLDSRDNKGSFDVEFDLDGRIDITGTGDAVKVVRTVYNGLLDAINQNKKIKKIEFSSLKSEPSRVRLYTTLMNNVAKKLGWETDVWESNNFIAPEKSSYDFEITKPRTKQVAPVEKVLDVVDVKSEVQQDKIKFSKSVNEDFNKIIEQTTGIASEKVYSEAKAKVRGANKGNKKFFIPYSAEDFMGLIYPLLSKGKVR